MNALDLSKDWLALPDIGCGDRRLLEQHGVTREAVHRAGGLAVARIGTTRRLWMPEPTGTPAFVLPVWTGPAPSIYQAVEHPLLIDMIAWRPDSPTRWHYRLGTPGAVLGADNLGLAHGEGWPITFELTPLAWLLANCRGAVLLDLVEAHWRTEDETAEGARAAAWWGGEAA